VGPPARFASDPVSLVAAGNPSWIGSAGITAGWTGIPYSKHVPRLTRCENDPYFNRLKILRCIKWIDIHAFLKGKSSRRMQRIMVLNI
jgi:hypothetical protein